MFIENCLGHPISFFGVRSVCVHAFVQAHHFKGKMTQVSFTLREEGKDHEHEEVRVGHFSTEAYYLCPIHCCRSVAQLCPTLCDPIDCSTPGLPVPRCLPVFAQVHVHCIGDAVQPSYPLMPSPPSALNLSQHQGLFQ